MTNKNGSFYKSAAGRKDGFSLIEIMIVVILIGVMAILSVPLMSEWLTRQKLNLSTQESAALLQRARMLAVSQSTMTRVRVVGLNRLQLEVPNPAGSPPWISPKLERTAVELHGEYQFTEPLDAASHYENSYYFKPDGMIYQSSAANADRIGSHILQTHSKLNSSMRAGVDIHPTGKIRFNKKGECE